MLAATILHSLSAVCVLLIVIGFGVFLARKGWFDAPSHRGIVSKLVNAALPCFLFYSVISKFSHGELYNLLKFAGLPFLTVGLNFLISVLFIKLGWVRPHMKGTFIAAFTGATVLFVGVPLVQTMYGSSGIPYLLVYFFANCVFIWRNSNLFPVNANGDVLFRSVASFMKSGSVLTPVSRISPVLLCVAVPVLISCSRTS